MITREQERFAKNVLNCAYALTIPPSFVRLCGSFFSSFVFEGQV
jgi:hypothetical protein